MLALMLKHADIESYIMEAGKRPRPLWVHLCRVPWVGSGISVVASSTACLCDWDAGLLLLESYVTRFMTMS